MLDVVDRLERERQFHNERFAGGPRARQAKFYRTIQPSLDKYVAKVHRLSVGADIFELGCATGTNVLSVPPTFRTACGVDISDVAVAKANDRAKAAGLSNVRFIAADAENTGLPSESIDLVFGSGIIHHLDIKRSATEVARLLRPGGRALFVEPLGHNPLINGYRGRTPEARTPDEHPLLKGDFAILAESFSTIEVVFFGLCAVATAPLHKYPGFNAVRSIARGLDAILLRLPGVKWWSWYSMITLTK